MTDRHPLDGNAIAADAHYEDRPEHHDFCDRCGCLFEADPNDEDAPACPQHPVMFMYCEDCGDDMQAEMEDER